MASFLITGAAGFIGAHLGAALARAGHRVRGVDSFNAYYDPALKHARVATLWAPLGLHCQALDLTTPGALLDTLRAEPVDQVIHLAAQPGVRHSLKAPLEFVQANLLGFGQVLEACRQAGVERLLYASSSSVYGHRSQAPFVETDRVDRPASLYAATKAANELMAHAYAQQHGLASIGLRFFTVYGPWGRPDMAVWSFTRKLLDGTPITLYDHGQLLRDFTYIDDVVAAVLALATRTQPVPGAEVVNVGHHQPHAVMDLLRALELATGRTAWVDAQPAPPSEVPMTCADDQRLRSWLGDWPCTPLPVGLARFVSWFQTWEQARMQHPTAPRLEPVLAGS